MKASRMVLECSPGRQFVPQHHCYSAQNRVGNIPIFISLAWSGWEQITHLLVSVALCQAVFDVISWCSRLHQIWLFVSMQSGSIQIALILSEHTILYHFSGKLSNVHFHAFCLKKTLPTGKQLVTLLVLCLCLVRLGKIQIILWTISIRDSYMGRHSHNITFRVTEWFRI